MASNRHLGRIVALQTLYEDEFRQSDESRQPLAAVTVRNLERYKNEIGDTEFVYNLVNGVTAAIADLDARLQPLAPDWPIEQIARIDRTILRMGLYELVYCSNDVPARVAINEAVELAKSFGSDNSSKFINGVLGTAYRMLGESQAHERNTQV
ncbi:transcription antitermination factor NusB [Candidatus Saccharibacteria bacterium]|jgi:transcription antitermination factor nusB|nr:transcription antitermination factor NusB [Candidatus Saccharibacteria bacterium]